MSDDFLEQMQDRDRARARQRLQTAPHELSDYEVRLVGGGEYRDHMRRLEAARTSAHEVADRALRYREAVTVTLCPPGITFRNGLLRRLNTHAIELAVRHGLTVKRSPDGGGWASQETNTICVPAAISEEAYAVVLHEIGHVVDPEADSRQYRNFIEGGHLHALGGELGAWRWAYTHALVWTIEMQQRLYESLQRHPAYHAATADERWAMRLCLTNACLRVTGKTWTFGELDERCASLRG